MGEGNLCCLALRGVYFTEGILCYSPSGLGKTAWPRREAGSPRGLSAASYRLCSTSRTIWRHSASYPSADTVRSRAQHVREGEGRGAETHRSPSVQSRVFQVCAKGPADVRSVARGRDWQRNRWNRCRKEGRHRSDSPLLWVWTSTMRINAYLT